MSQFLKSGAAAAAFGLTQPDMPPDAPFNGASSLRPIELTYTDARGPANENLPEPANDNSAVAAPEPKQLILGVALTGAKFTPHNHVATGSRVVDAINCGDTIPCTQEQVARELNLVYGLGARYIHWHARSHVTREQTCSTEAYRDFGLQCKRACPEALVSFGGSRNGPEVSAAIAQFGEWARMSQAALPMKEGGAHFATAQAAVELQIVKDMERQGFVSINDKLGNFTICDDIQRYKPSAEMDAIDLPIYSTARGSNYGRSSAKIQLETLQRTILERHQLGLPFEVEWIQTARSSMLTWYLVNVLAAGRIKRLNITVLFGFSPRLPFPRCYAEFKAVIEKARATVEIDSSPVKVSIACGAAVLPQQAPQHVRPLDVGPPIAKRADALERLIAYACQPDSGVDIVRVGMEDTPYILDPAGTPLPASNPLLVKEALQYIARYRGKVVTDLEALKRFSKAV